MDAPTALGKVLRSLRLERALTQQQVAERSGIPRSTVSAYERGVRDMYIGELYRLAEVFGVQPSKIVEAAGEAAIQNDNGPAQS